MLADSMIEATNLTKFYGDRPAIQDLSFSIGEGAIVGFLGLNGTGKTTTLRIISCQLVPSAGSVRVAGFDVLENPHEIRRKIGYLPETPPLYLEMTVRSYLEFAARLKGLNGPLVSQRVKAVEEVTQLGEVRDQVIGTLSHGYMQRVGIAQAVVHKPALIILDEPFTGLDPSQTKEMREMIHGLGGEHTVLLSSHRLEQIRQLCDKLIVLDPQGRLAFKGSEEQFVALTTGKALQLMARGELSDVIRAIESIEGIASHQVSEQADGVIMATIQVEMDRTSWERRRPEGSPERDAHATETHDDVREALAAAMHEAGLGLRELRRAENEMESVFVQLTRSQRSDEPPDAKDEPPAEKQEERS
jgi:ABC-2 type transport system ATP-binding protein